MSSDGGDAGGREGQEEAEEGSQSSDLILKRGSSSFIEEGKGSNEACREATRSPFVWNSLLLEIVVSFPEQMSRMSIRAQHNHPSFYTPLRSDGLDLPTFLSFANERSDGFDGSPRLEFERGG